jgi:hypothetical protein
MTFSTPFPCAGRTFRILAVLALAAAGCGGSGKKDTSEPGGSHETTPGGEGGEGGTGTSSPEAADAGPGAEVAPDAAPARAPVVFVLKNEGKSDLTFALDKGWGGSIFAYSGKPPKATPVLVFPRYCTAACDGSGEGGVVCPTCKEAEDPKERQKEEKAETVRQVVAAGSSYELAWDGQIIGYEKAPKESRGKNKKCECWKKQPAPPAEYTVRACALRTTSAVGKTSQMECVEGTVTLPVVEGSSTDVVLTFADKPPGKPAKGHK